MEAVRSLSRAEVDRLEPAPLFRRGRLFARVLLCAALVLSARGAEAQVVPVELVRRAVDLGSVPVIVRLAVEVTPEGTLGDEAVTRQRQRIATAQSSVLTALTGHGHRVRHRYSTLPFLAVEVGPAALAALERLTGIVARVEPDALASPTLAESVPLVQGNAAWDAGFTGSGKVVAILDTGVERTHAFLTGKVVEEACYSGNGNCPNGSTSQTGSGAGIPCDYAGACSHGTHVAGIAAGLGSPGASFAAGGVAKGANLMAVQVFSRFTGTACGTGPDPCAKSYTSDQLAGLERVYALRGVHAFASVNMSLGGGQHFSNCDSDSRKVAVDNLRSVGIATVIASGNDGSADSTTAPACISTSVSVGSTDDGSSGTIADTLSSFTNRASFLSLLAPGRWITSSIPGGSSAYSGTSMAAPHVAGAWAVLKQASPSASVSEILTAFQTTGVPVTDPASGIVKPRIRVLPALQTLSGALSSGNFHTVAPCRLVDTREAAGPRGGPALLAAASRTFPVAGFCGIPLTAKAVAANVTVVLPTDYGHLKLSPAGTPSPTASTVNFRPGIVRANNAILSLSAVGEISVFCGMDSGSTHYVLDVSGYFD